MKETPRSGLQIALRPATLADWGTIRRWLRQPEIEAWWGPASSTEAEVLIALQSESSICRLIVNGELAIGYCHAIDAATWGEDLPEELEPGTWDLDIFVAEPGHRGKGAGHTALALLKQEVFSSTLAVAVCVFTSVRNEAATRAYEKAGFRWQRIWNDSAAGPSWFMVAHRAADTKP
jgi:aminoglycoside 6'-N-acetyltransferase